MIQDAFHFQPRALTVRRFGRHRV